MTRKCLDKEHAKTQVSWEFYQTSVFSSKNWLDNPCRLSIYCFEAQVDENVTCSKEHKEKKLSWQRAHKNSSELGILSNFSFSSKNWLDNPCRLSVCCFKAHPAKTWPARKEHGKKITEQKKIIVNNKNIVIF